MFLNKKYFYQKKKLANNPWYFERESVQMQHYILVFLLYIYSISKICAYQSRQNEAFFIVPASESVVSDNITSS